MSEHWWQQGAVYQIYPRSFQDSNGDGVGDIPGIISRLDYLQELGVAAIWLSPVYLSPNADNGYDIADYRAINPEYGTMADMDALIAAAKTRGIRVVMDLVVNHTSDEHPWFVSAKADLNSDTRDYYVWADPVDGHEPNGLTSGFIGGSAWELDPVSGQYFLHLFSEKQVDLNWESRKMRRAVYDMMNFWIDRGISGFRMDVIDMIGKEPMREILVNGPHLHDYLHEMNRATWVDRDFMTVGEAWSAGPKEALQYSDPDHQELSMIFQFGHMWADRKLGGEKWETKPLDIAQLKEALYENQTVVGEKGWNSLFWNNHDLPRAVSRFGATGAQRVAAAKMLAITLHGLKGTPFIFQGEEFGMTDCPVDSIDQVDDVEARTIYRQLVAGGDDAATAMAKLNVFSRDNARTPVQWSDEPQAGFTTGTPWLAVNPNYHDINAAAALADPTSIFWTYRDLLALRRQSAVLRQGRFDAIDSVPDQVFAYTRTLADTQYIVVSNFAGTPVSVDLPDANIDVLVTNGQNEQDQLGRVSLAPYAAFIAQII